MLMFGLRHSYSLYKSMTLDVGESFYKVVCNHLFGRDVRGFDILCGYFFTNVKMLDINMLSS